MTDTFNKSAADDFENVLTKIWNISINESILIALRVEHIVTKGESAYELQCCKGLRKHLYAEKGQDSCSAVKSLKTLWKNSAPLPTHLWLGKQFLQKYGSHY